VQTSPAKSLVCGYVSLISGVETMKALLLLCLLLGFGSLNLKAENTSRFDTIAHWPISYNGQIIIRGNETGQIEQIKRGIKVKSPQDKLIIDYRYDAVKPQVRTIIIKQNGVMLYKGIQHLKDNHPSIIFMKEVIQDSKAKAALLEIYYSDDILKGKERMIGQIQVER
jgi:hypothetical protein